MKNILKNFTYTIFSNLSTTVISTCVIFIIPKLVSPTQYGLFQIFTFYFSYAGLLQIGWLDGIYLRFGGMHYNMLNKALFKGQQYLYIAFQFIILIVISLCGLFTTKPEYKFIIITIAFGIFFANLKNFYQIILQMTNRIAEFAVSNIITSGVYAVLLLIFIIGKCDNYRYYILFNIAGQIISFIYTLVICKGLFVNRISAEYRYDEVKKNMYVGSKISFAGIAAMLILGVVRVGIQKEWSVETFGRVSLVLSVSNLLMLFINAASLVLFPIIKRIKDISKAKLYNTIEEVFLPVLFLLLLLYYPANVFINYWLPTYRSSLVFMAFLFPLGLYQGKFEVLTNTFFKVWRMENKLLLVNVLSLILATFLTIVFSYVVHSLQMTIFTIIVSMMFRSFLAELIIKRKVKNHSWIFFASEFTLVNIFILSNIFFNVMTSFLVYLVSNLLYLIINKKKIKKSFLFLKNIKYDTTD